MYTPHPIDTTTIVLPESLNELMELIAENVHENWAQARIKEGWTYGPLKSDRQKTTPLLIPYADLPESEKEYDRLTAMETLRTILKLGYKITK
ncbi:RyR domain-containing protein [Ileibacterium valens]|uniref:RyR domain-containing protein n=1 Tax=Ileibacterium valens TaxID=1862668 RepID=UPI00272B3FA1|nr:RyR domain-containing protein [Ileibacterium valens]